jgi:hypothetical protein
MRWSATFCKTGGGTHSSSEDFLSLKGVAGSVAMLGYWAQEASECNINSVCVLCTHGRRGC